MSKESLTKMELEEIDRPIYYADEHFIVIRFDVLNLAILDREKFHESNRISKSVLGYYGNLAELLFELSELEIDKKLCGQGRTEALFQDLDTFIYTYIRRRKEILKSIVGTLESKSKDNFGNEIKNHISEVERNKLSTKDNLIFEKTIDVDVMGPFPWDKTADELYPLSGKVGFQRKELDEEEKTK